MHTSTKRIFRKLSFTAVLVAGALASGGATECGQVIDDSGFELWCDDHLCEWQVEKGEIARAATWNDKDSGVEMVGEDTAISQLTPVDFHDGHCIRFTLVADVAETAQVNLELDVYGDGTVEDTERIPTSDWHKLSFLVRMPEYYQGVRFRLTKIGSGHAVLANIGADMAKEDECSGAPLVLGPRPYGATCTGDTECASNGCLGDSMLPDGAIWPGVCSTCFADAGCGPGNLCAPTGVNMGVLDVAPHCVPVGSVPTGAACDRDVECASGMCAGKTCMGCETNNDCAGGRTCGLVQYVDDNHFWNGPFTCGPGGGPGAACLSNAECGSDVCNGPPLKICRNSVRECNVETDCPDFGTDGVTSCVTVGIRGGVCQ